eukprot:TRINITY_DN6564_c0_g2_i1.p1 TRINITY_DN6564_c0_g2~~TRINITY_DN6564_c0_g2_i1.p1  ORF type:complete len:281 (+),score=37.22 TRINITY_DN6564_c0_g2_i1:90-932(+)
MRNSKSSESLTGSVIIRDDNEHSPIGSLVLHRNRSPYVHSPSGSVILHSQLDESMDGGSVIVRKSTSTGSFLAPPRSPQNKRTSKRTSKNTKGNEEIDILMSSSLNDSFSTDSSTALSPLSSPIQFNSISTPNSTTNSNQKKKKVKNRRKTKQDDIGYGDMSPNRPLRNRKEVSLDGSVLKMVVLPVLSQELNNPKNSIETKEILQKLMENFSSLEESSPQTIPRLLQAFSSSTQKDPIVVPTINPNTTGPESQIGKVLLERWRTKHLHQTLSESLTDKT